MDGHHYSAPVPTGSSNRVDSEETTPMRLHKMSVTYVSTPRLLSDANARETPRPPADTSHFVSFCFPTVNIEPTRSNEKPKPESKKPKGKVVSKGLMTESPSTLPASYYPAPTNRILYSRLGEQGTTTMAPLTFPGSPQFRDPIGQQISTPLRHSGLNSLVAAALVVSTRNTNASNANEHNVTTPQTPLHSSPHNSALPISKNYPILTRPPRPVYPAPQLAPLKDQHRSPEAARVDVHRLVNYMPSFTLPRASHAPCPHNPYRHYSPNVSGSTSPSIASPANGSRYVQAIQPAHTPPVTPSPVLHKPKVSPNVHSDFTVNKEIKKNCAPTIKGFACDYHGCNKSFARRYNLRVHSRRHTDEVPYPCKVSSCPNRFKWRSSLAHHMKSRHPEYQAATQSKKSSNPMTDNDSSDSSSHPNSVGSAANV